MIVWHLAGVLFLFRWIFRDPKVDVRFLLAGAVLPDAVDMTIGTVLFADRYSSGELWMHTLLAPSLAGILVLLATRRGRVRRAWMALVVGMFFHLLLDGMWQTSEVFAWPFFGFGFPRGPDPYWSGVFARALADPWRWVREAAGVVYLVWLWLWAGLGDPARRAQLVRDGRLMPADV